MKQAITKQLSGETEQRILEAAGEVFAEQGFRNATIREICKRAHANVAAINYHFHDKEGLYHAVLKYAHLCAAEAYPSGLFVGKGAEERLGAFIRGRLRIMFDEGRPSWRGKIMARELIEPTQALDHLVQEELRPRFRELQAVVRELLGDRADDEQVRFCCLSVIGQCVFLHNARQVIGRVDPRMKFTPAEIEKLALHITRFSLGALKQLRKELDNSKS
jgi:AcrR family transcriptional regulator